MSDAAVGLLAGFHQGHKKAGQGGAAAVEDVREFVFARRGFEAQIHAAGLEILAIGATGHFQELPCPGAHTSMS